MTGPRILVVGCGAIGGVVAAHLLEIGQDVSVLTTNADIARALSESGVRVRGEGAPAATMKPVTIHRELPTDVAPFDYVLLATQPPQVEAAANSALPALAPTGRMVCFQNGLCEERVAKLAGAERATEPQPGEDGEDDDDDEQGDGEGMIGHRADTHPSRDPPARRTRAQTLAPSSTRSSSQPQ